MAQQWMGIYVVLLERPGVAGQVKFLVSPQEQWDGTDDAKRVGWRNSGVVCSP
jgi:hypothetical protein